MSAKPDERQCREWMIEGRERVRVARKHWQRRGSDVDLGKARDWWYLRWHECGRVLGPERINQINDQVAAQETSAD